MSIDLIRLKLNSLPHWRYRLCKQLVVYSSAQFVHTADSTDGWHPDVERLELRLPIATLISEVDSFQLPPKWMEGNCEHRNGWMWRAQSSSTVNIQHRTRNWRMAMCKSRNSKCQISIGIWFSTNLVVRTVAAFRWIVGDLSTVHYIWARNLHTKIDWKFWKHFVDLLMCCVECWTS